jgi:hypothetical protein
MAWMIWAALLYRSPLLAGLLVGVAAGTVFVPAFTVPIWLSFYRGRGASRFMLTFAVAAGFCLALVGGLIALSGETPAGWRSVWALSNWQPWKAPPEETLGIWTGWKSNPGVYRLPVFLAYIAFVDLAHVLALNAAVLIGVQFWYADQGGIYVLWYLPFVLLLMFRTNLTACQPGPPTPDWLNRSGRWIYRSFRRLLRLPEPAAPVR